MRSYIYNSGVRERSFIEKKNLKNPKVYLQNNKSKKDEIMFSQVNHIRYIGKEKNCLIFLVWQLVGSLF